MFDYSLYLVTDRSLSRGRTTCEVVKAAVAGGVTVVQLREKDCSTRQFIAEARLLKQLLLGTGIPLIINDRLDVALAVGAEGLHLGQQDMTIADARRIAGPDMVIGISAESLDDALRAEAEGADYIGISPVFATTTKKDAAAPLGLEGIRRIRRGGQPAPGRHRRHHLGQCRGGDAGRGGRSGGGVGHCLRPLSPDCGGGAETDGC